MNPSSSSSSSSPFPPSQPLPIPEDTVFYSIYPDFLLIESPWHHEPFTLSPSLSPLPRLHGKTRFGDFLLIESAFHLPRWLNPDQAKNRIFIRNGKLQIIPKSLLPDPKSLDSALAVLSLGKTDAAYPVQSAIKKRIAGYPERAMANIHTAWVRVPLPVAQVLKHEPALISLAVEGFYNRDIDAMKLAARMERFLGEEMVVVPLTMSRAMYGQLAMQSFAAPKCYPMPGPAEAGYREAEMGKKKKKKRKQI